MSAAGIFACMDTVTKKLGNGGGGGGVIRSTLRGDEFTTHTNVKL